MTLISLEFALFVGLLTIIYFISPKKYQWLVLLAGSYIYYLNICNIYILYMMVTTVTTWAGAIAIDRIYKEQKATVKEHKKDWDRAQRKAYKESMLKKCKRMMILVLLLNFGILGFLKYSAFALSIAQSIASLFSTGVHFPSPSFILPLGISFYTFQSMGYIIDVYMEKVDAEYNLPRFALFVSFFPQIIQGPIAMYEDLAHQLYESHSFEFLRLKNGLMLIMWGAFKKMVIADRAVDIINYVTADSSQFSGTYILITTIIYALQLYADFSGGIDIVRGIAQILGIDMAENFRRPYFSTSLTEYWHRWHITLGNWVRTYVFYPLSISKTFLNMGRNMSQKWSKHIGKVVPTSLASLITFLIIGIWHGANGKYVAFGLWNGGVIMLIELVSPITERIFEKLHVNVKSFLYRIVAMTWTFILVLVGYYFDIAKDFSDAMSMLLRSVIDFHFTDLCHLSPLTLSGVDYKDFLVLLAGAIIIFISSLIQEITGKEIRELLWQRHYLLQACLILAGLACIIVFGCYGPDFNPADFVYMQF